MRREVVAINNDQLKIIVQAILDKQKSTSEINAQISQIKTKALEVGINISDKEAKQHLSEYTQMQETLGKTEQSRLKAQISLEKKQAAAQNKYLEDEYKQRQRLSEQQKVQEQIDKNLRFDKIKLDNNLTSWLNENTKGAEFFRDRIEEIRSQIESADSAQFTGLNKQFQALQSEARTLGLTGKTVFSDLKDNIIKFGSWFGIGTLIAGTIREIKQMISTVQDLNKVMVDLQIASGFSKAQVVELMNSYNQLGQRIGATTAEIGKSADSWLRQGYSIEQTNELVEASMMLSKLGQIDSAEATQYLTSAMKGYKVAAEDVVSIVDKLTKVDMEAAVSSGQIAEGLSRVSNSAQIAGVDLDKLIGYLTVIGEVTQKSLGEVGNSLNAVFARMGNIKLSRLDDYQNDGEDLNNVETVLRGLDIQLRSSAGEFRNFSDVLDEVAAKWESYGSVQQNAIAVAFAGKYSLCSNM